MRVVSIVGAFEARLDVAGARGLRVYRPSGILPCFFGSGTAVPHTYGSFCSVVRRAGLPRMLSRRSGVGGYNRGLALRILLPRWAGL